MARGYPAGKIQKMGESGRFEDSVTYINTWTDKKRPEEIMVNIALTQSHTTSTQEAQQPAEPQMVLFRNALFANIDDLKSRHGNILLFAYDIRTM